MSPWREMALNNAWANRTLLGAVARLPPEEFTAPRPGFFASIRDTLDHIHEVDLYYLDALEQGGRGRSVYDRLPFATAADLAQAQAVVDMALVRFCTDLTPATLGGVRITERSSGPVAEGVDALLLHLFQHQIHHRGQAHVQLSHAGVAPPQLDEFHLVHDRAPTAEEYH
jgi:uncharacterized damage-inducible protein DinB